MAWELPTNVTTLYDLLIWSNKVTDNSVIPFFLMAFILIIFIAFKATGYSNARSVVPALFIGTIGMTFFNVLGLVSGTIVITSWVLLGLSWMWLYFER